MFNKARGSLEKLLDALGVAKIPLKPNTITITALALSPIVPAMAYLGASPSLVAIVLLASASLDGLDGYIAKKKGMQSTFGAFLDSTADRVSDSLYTCALAAANIVDYPYALALLTAEFVVSYTRARAESLGVNLAGVGLMERGERTIFKAIILFSASFHVGVARTLTFLLLALTAATVLQRVAAVKKALECR